MIVRSPRHPNPLEFDFWAGTKVEEAAAEAARVLGYKGTWRFSVGNQTVRPESTVAALPDRVDLVEVSK